MREVVLCVGVTFILPSTVASSSPFSLSLFSDSGSARGLLATRDTLDCASQTTLPFTRAHCASQQIWNAGSQSLTQACSTVYPRTIRLLALTLSFCIFVAIEGAYPLRRSLIASCHVRFCKRLSKTARIRNGMSDFTLATISAPCLAICSQLSGCLPNICFPMLGLKFWCRDARAVGSTMISAFLL